MAKRNFRRIVLKLSGEALAVNKVLVLTLMLLKNLQKKLLL